MACIKTCLNTTSHKSIPTIKLEFSGTGRNCTSVLNYTLTHVVQLRFNKEITKQNE